jgi:4-hydroxy-tetrahydrodipicolinate synthase
LDQNGDLDVAGLERLVARALKGGVSCLFPLGWAGEGPLLPNRVRERVMRETCRIAAGRVPVMAGISEQSLPRALELAAMAKAAGAALVLSTPPFSYIVPQRLVYGYFKELAARAGLPLVIYQNDEVGVKVENDTLVQLSEAPGIVGVKAFVNFLQLQRSFRTAHKPGRFAVMSGDEYLYSSALLMGVRHFTMGGPGNLSPAWCVRMYKAALAGDWRTVATMQARMAEFCDALYIGADSAYAAVKHSLQCLGLCSARITPPHRPLPRAQQRQVERALATYPDLVKG